MTTDTLVRDRTAVSEPDLPSVMAEMGRRAREAATTLSLVSAEAKVEALNNAAAADLGHRRRHIRFGCREPLAHQSLCCHRLSVTTRSSR